MPMQGNLVEMLQKMGRDVALPGVQLAIDLLEELKADLENGGRLAYEAAPAIAGAPAKRLGRPPGTGKKTVAATKGGNSGWPTDPEERKIEAARRMAVAKARRGGKGMGHPRDPHHPGHDAWVKKMAAANRKHWKNLSPKKKKERIAKMLVKRDQSARTAVEEFKATA